MLIDEKPWHQSTATFSAESCFTENGFRMAPLHLFERRKFEQTHFTWELASLRILVFAHFFPWSFNELSLEKVSCRARRTFELFLSDKKSQRRLPTPTNLVEIIGKLSTFYVSIFYGKSERCFQSKNVTARFLRSHVMASFKKKRTSVLLVIIYPWLEFL